MPRLTTRHYNWLAVHVAPMLQPGKADEFADKVEEFGSNERFDRAKFIDVSATSWQLSNERTEPETIIDDSIPYLEEPYVIDSNAA